MLRRSPTQSVVCISSFVKARDCLTAISTPPCFDFVELVGLSHLVIMCAGRKSALSGIFSVNQVSLKQIMS